MEVLRKEPRLSYSASASLDKYLAEERAKHNNRDNHEKLNKPDDDKPMTATGADLVSGKLQQQRQCSEPEVSSQGSSLRQQGPHSGG